MFARKPGKGITLEMYIRNTQVNKKKKEIIEENFPNLKKEMPINIQEAYRTTNRLNQKRSSSHHIIVKTPNAQNKERILKAVGEKVK